MTMTKTVSRIALLLGALLAPLALHAQPFEAGKHYFPIEPAQPTATPGKVEVVEVFSYRCVHCWSFQSKVDTWKKKAPANVQFTYLPAPFNKDYELAARGYYAAEALGALDKTHGGVYDALWVKKMPAGSIEELAALYETLGVPAADFTAAASSFAVSTKIKRSLAVIGRYGVEGTPTIVVNGKYRVTGESAGGYDKVFAVVDHLVAMESATAPAAL
jgi:protein dithiol oxidoreductase (disulfide-forming)